MLPSQTFMTRQSHGNAGAPVADTLNGEKNCSKLVGFALNQNKLSALVTDETWASPPDHDTTGFTTKHQLITQSMTVASRREKNTHRHGLTVTNGSTATDGLMTSTTKKGIDKAKWIQEDK
jgi:hypothetical protein